MIELPACPRINDAVPKLVGYFTDQTPILGGSQSRVGRIGDRWGIDVVTAPAEYAEEGMVMVSRLTRGMTDTVLLGFPEPGVERLDYGAPVVSAPSAGSNLPLSGLKPGAQIREGKFLSVIVLGQRFLYQAAATRTEVGGVVLLPIHPMIRVQPPVGSVVELADPKIEGFVQGNEQSWQVSRSKYLPFSFAVLEVE